MPAKAPHARSTRWLVAAGAALALSQLVLSGCATCHVDVEALTVPFDVPRQGETAAQHEAAHADLWRTVADLPGCPLRPLNSRLRCLLRRAERESDCWRRVAFLEEFHETVSEKRGGKIDSDAADELIAGARDLLATIEPCVYECEALHAGRNYLVPEVFESPSQERLEVERSFSLPADGVYALRVVNGVAGARPPSSALPSAVPLPLPTAAVGDAEFRLDDRPLVLAETLSVGRADLCIPVRLGAGTRTLALDLRAGQEIGAMEVSVVGIAASPPVPEAELPEYRECQTESEAQGPEARAPGYGLFWVGDPSRAANERLAFPAAAQEPDFFDPAKPSIVFIHGYQSWSEWVGEGWNRRLRDKSLAKGSAWDIDPWPDMTRFKSRGWNTAVFDWRVFAAEGKSLSSDARRTEEKVWVDDPAPPMRWRTCDVSGSKSDSDANGPLTSVPALFLEDYVEMLGQYCPDLEGCDLPGIHLVGHSMGTQVIARFLKLLPDKVEEPEAYWEAVPEVTVLDPGFALVNLGDDEAPGDPEKVREYLSEARGVVMLKFLEPKSPSWARQYSLISREAYDLWLGELGADPAWSTASKGHSEVVHWFFGEEKGPPVPGADRTFQDMPYCDPAELGPPPAMWPCGPMGPSWWPGDPMGCFGDFYLWLMPRVEGRLRVLGEGVDVAVRHEGQWCLETCDMPETPVLKLWQEPICPPRATLFTEPGFEGADPRVVHQDMGRLPENGDLDSVSSVEVATGCRATLFEREGFDGDSLVLEESNEDLGGFDAVRSIRISCNW